MMSKELRIFFVIMITTAFGFGYLHHLIPGRDFVRLHIFLYNLVTGGTILLYYTQGIKRMTLKTWSFFVFSLLFVILTFYNLYKEAIIIALILALISELVRLEKFPLFPSDVFTRKTSVAEKFLQAALLCLSIGLILSSLALWNEETGLGLRFKTFTLDTFFLGFSFPLSLLSLAVAFDLIKKENQLDFLNLKSLDFWIITIGVIIFYGFILANLRDLELIIALVLFVSVISVLVLFFKETGRSQQEIFLLSGICFLAAVATLGVTYLIFYFIPGDNSGIQSVDIRYHAMMGLYGWTMSGLIVISRMDDFPLQINPRLIVAAHWIIVVGFAPLGYYNRYFAFLAVISYFVFLSIVFLIDGRPDKEDQMIS